MIEADAKAIFLEAVEELSQERRAILIDKACAGDDALRARVEELLAAHKIDSFLERPVVPIDATIEHNSFLTDRIVDATLPVTGTNRNSSNRPAVGDKIRYFGDYELLEEIARGGMGVVYRARQTSLDRIVAIKMILAGQLASKSDIRRFYVEARAAANLDHPGIVPIFEIGEHDGAHYFSMAFIEGKSLEYKLNDGPLSPKLAALYVKKIADAIQYAHDHGVVH